MEIEGIGASSVHHGSVAQGLPSVELPVLFIATILVCESRDRVDIRLCMRGRGTTAAPRAQNDKGPFVDMVIKY